MARRLQRLATKLLACLFILQAGCGILTDRKDQFPNAETGEHGELAGQDFLLDDLRDIANDEDLSLDEKREAFRMTVEGEEYIMIREEGIVGVVPPDEPEAEE